MARPYDVSAYGATALQRAIGISIYLPISPYISLYLPISPYGATALQRAIGKGTYSSNP